MIAVRKRSRDQRGVTLIEMLVTMGLMAGFLIILTSIFTASFEVQSQSVSYSAVSADGRFVLARLEYDIRRASAVNQPAVLGDTDPSLSLVINGSNYVYSVSGGRLQLSIDGSYSYLTGDQTLVSELVFQTLGSPGSSVSIRYGFSLTGKTGHHPDTQTFGSAAELRL